MESESIRSMMNPINIQQQMQDKFKQVDINNSGTLSFEEIQSAAKTNGKDVSKAENMFKKMDTDQNGEVTEQEIKARMDMMKEKISGNMAAMGNMLNGNTSTTQDPTASVSTLLEMLNSQAEFNSAEQIEIESLTNQLKTEGLSSELINSTLGLFKGMMPPFKTKV